MARWYKARMSTRTRSITGASGGRAIAALLLVAGCGGAAAPGAPAPAPAPPVPVDDPTRGCKDAAAGLERGTRGVRSPEVSLLGPMYALCVDDAWSAEVIECFAALGADGFGRCAAQLPPRRRQRLFDRIGGGGSDRVALASALARLSVLHVGIPECDQFIAAVAGVLVCDAMAIEVRAELGAETADFWSLPTSGLPADAQLRMADVCGRSTAALAQQAADAGCAP
jgi:hypothetical protein